MNKQKFAWLPKMVWNMKTKDYRYTLIWLCWYWDDGSNEKDKPSCYHRLSDDPYEDTRLWDRHRVRSTTNLW